MNQGTRVAVVGAGLGGLSAAGFLQRSGFAVKVYEQAPTFSRIGAGIILSANATKVLRRLGLERALIAAGIKSHHYVSRAWDTGEPRAPWWSLYPYPPRRPARRAGTGSRCRNNRLRSSPGGRAAEQRLNAPRLCQWRRCGGGYRHRRRRHSLESPRIPARPRAAAICRRRRVSRNLSGGTAQRL